MTTSKQESVDNNININIRINEEYAGLVPVISESEYETIKQSIKQDGQHVPVIINQKGEILDGHTRFKACKELGIAPRTMMREEFEDPLLEKQFIIDINRNRRHLNPFQRIELQYKSELIESELAKRRQLSTLPEKGQKGFRSVSSKNLPDIKEQGKGRVLDISATKAHVSSETYRKGSELVKEGLSKEVLEKLRTEELKIDRVYRANKKQEKLEYIQSITNPQTDKELMDKLGIDIAPYDFWSFNHDRTYGQKHPGQIPATLVFNTLYFFTEQGDLVLDPMADGGVVGDVCMAMKRRCKMYDIDPKRDDIIRRDITHVPEAADLVFWDPPYYKKIADQYCSDSISALPRTDYLKIFYEAAENFATAGVKKVALLMSDYDDEYNGKSEENIFVDDYIYAFKHNNKWRIHRIIQCPLNPHKIHPATINNYREKKKLARISRSLIIFVRTDQQEAKV